MRTLCVEHKPYHGLGSVRPSTVPRCRPADALAAGADQPGTTIARQGYTASFSSFAGRKAIFLLAAI